MMAGPSSGRLRCLQALAFGRLKLSVHAKDELIERLCPGKQGFHDLTNAEADRVIDAMKVLAGQTPMRPQARERRRARDGAAGDVALLVTPAQRERIAELTRELIALQISSAYLAGVRLRACGRPEPATAQDAEHVIEALKALNERAAAGWRPEAS